MRIVPARMASSWSALSDKGAFPRPFPGLWRISVAWVVVQGKPEFLPGRGPLVPGEVNPGELAMHRGSVRAAPQGAAQVLRCFRVPLLPQADHAAVEGGLG